MRLIRAQGACGGDIATLSLRAYEAAEHSCIPGPVGNHEREEQVLERMTERVSMCATQTSQRAVLRREQSKLLRARHRVSMGGRRCPC